jgi:hypothetical protein
VAQALPRPAGPAGSTAAFRLTLPLPAAAALLVAVPVFLQAPWVRSAPMAAAAFTAPLLALAVWLARRGGAGWSPLGVLLVGFAGSWLGGGLFWGWCRLHPLWHLPVEAFALPLAVAGLGSRWRLAGSFYLASLLGTAATDAAMAATGVIDLWPRVLAAPLEEAPLLLQTAAQQLLAPLPLAILALATALLLGLARLLWPHGICGRVAATCLATTLAVDGLFLAAALLAPRLTGLL